MKAIANRFLCLFKHACSVSSVEITALERARQDRIMLSITANKVSCDCSEFLTRRVHTTEDGYFSAQQLAVWAIFIGHFIQLHNHISSFFPSNINDKNGGLLFKYVLVLDQRKKRTKLKKSAVFLW